MKLCVQFFKLIILFMKKKLLYYKRNAIRKKIYELLLLCSPIKFILPPRKRKKKLSSWEFRMHDKLVSHGLISENLLRSRLNLRPNTNRNPCRIITNLKQGSQAWNKSKIHSKRAKKLLLLLSLTTQWCI